MMTLKRTVIGAACDGHWTLENQSLMAPGIADGFITAAASGSGEGGGGSSCGGSGFGGLGELLGGRWLATSQLARAVFSLYFAPTMFPWSRKTAWFQSDRSHRCDTHVHAVMQTKLSVGKRRQ